MLRDRQPKRDPHAWQDLSRNSNLQYDSWLEAENYELGHRLFECCLYFWSALRIRNLHLCVYGNRKQHLSGSGLSGLLRLYPGLLSRYSVSREGSLNRGRPLRVDPDFFEKDPQDRFDSRLGKLERAIAYRNLGHLNRRIISGKEHLK